MTKTRVQAWEIFELEVNKRGTITIPSEIRDKYHIEGGKKVTLGLLSVEGETQQERNWKNRDKMIRVKVDQYIKQEKIKHDDEDKARSKAIERLKEEYLTDE